MSSHLGVSPNYSFIFEYFKKMPEDTRFIEVSRILKSLWEQCKQKSTNNNVIKKKLGRGIYSNRRIFDFYISGKRSPELRFLKRFIKHCEKNLISIPEKFFKLTKVKFGHGGNASSAKLPIEFSLKLAYLIGALRDGTLARNGKYEISYFQKDIRWLKTLKNLLKDVFKPSNEPRIVYRKNTSPKLTISNRPIFEFFHRIIGVPIGKKVNWATPKIILKSPEKIQNYYIRGFYDADGLTSYTIGFCQVNYSAIKDIKKFLEKRGILCSKITRRIRGKKYDVHYLYIKKKSFDKFMKIIGSSNPSKYEKLGVSQPGTNRGDSGRLLTTGGVVG